MAQVDIRKLVQMPCLRFGDLQFLSLDMDNEVSFDELLDEAANAAEGGDGKARFIDMCAKIFPTVAGSLAAKTAQTFAVPRALYFRATNDRHRSCGSLQTLLP